MNNKNLNHDNQPASTLSRESTALLSMMAERGLVNSLSITDEKKAAAIQEKKRLLFHNTAILLQNYRLIAWTLECFPEVIAEELNQPFTGLDALLEVVDLRLSLQNQRLESRIESVKKSRLLMDRINDALSLIKRKPEDGPTIYNVLYQTYIIPEKLSHADLLFRLNLSSRKYYRLRSQGIRLLSIRLWSAPTAELEAWIELLTLMSDV